MQRTITKKKKKEIACARLRNIRPVIIKQCVDRIKAIPIHKHARTLRTKGWWCWWWGRAPRRQKERARAHALRFILLTHSDRRHQNWKRKLCAHPSTIWRLRRGDTERNLVKMRMRAWYIETGLSYYHFIRSIDWGSQSVRAMRTSKWWISNTHTSTPPPPPPLGCCCCCCQPPSSTTRVADGNAPCTDISLVLWCALLRRDIFHIVSLRLSFV